MVLSRLREVLDLAGVLPPSRLELFASVLVGQGAEVIDPSEPDGIHPLMIPIARGSRGEVIGFLRWPTPLQDMPLQVVSQAAPNAPTLELVSPSVDAFLHRHVALRESQGETLSESLANAINTPDLLYAPGTLAASRLPLSAYLLIKVGENHAFFERLIEDHLRRGDTTAAAVTADRACKQDYGWARPWVFRALLLQQLEQPDEARDTARLALAEPIWTFGHPFSALATLAGWGTPTSIAYRKLASNPDKAPADRAAHWMDATAIDHEPWDGIRPILAELYEEAGLEHVSRLVQGLSR